MRFLKWRADQFKRKGDPDRKVSVVIDCLKAIFDSCKYGHIVHFCKGAIISQGSFSIAFSTILRVPFWTISDSILDAL